MLSYVRRVYVSVRVCATYSMESMRSHWNAREQQKKQSFSLNLDLCKWSESFQLPFVHQKQYGNDEEIYFIFILYALSFYLFLLSFALEIICMYTYPFNIIIIIHLWLCNCAYSILGWTFICKISLFWHQKSRKPSPQAISLFQGNLGNFGFSFIFFLSLRIPRWYGKANPVTARRWFHHYLHIHIIKYPFRRIYPKPILC